MEKSNLTFLGHNLRVIPLSEAKDDMDFRSFMAAAKGDMKQLNYAIFFETEAVHEGINGNGLRFFASDLKKLKSPFMYVPVKFEHDGPIVGTVVSSKFATDEDGAGLINVKGVLWSLEMPYFVNEILNSIASSPDTYGTSMECYYNPAHECDYGIGDKKISYQKFMEIGGRSMMGADYKGQGIVWQRPNNMTFTGLAMTATPADRQAIVNDISMAEANMMQQAYASIVRKPQEEYTFSSCSLIKAVVGVLRDNGLEVDVKGIMDDLLKEDVMKGEAAKKVEDVEDLEDVEEEEEVEEEAEEEEVEEEEVEEEAEEEAEDEEEEVEEEEEEEVEEEEEEAKPAPKKKIVKKVSSNKKVAKKRPDNEREALRVMKDQVISRIEEVFEAMKL